MDAEWLAAVGVVALISWTVGRNQRAAARRRAAASTAAPQANGNHPPTNGSHSGANGVSVPAPGLHGPPQIPSFVETHDEDDIDVTLVTASPFRVETTDGVEVDDAPNSSQERPPTVNVLYEKEAELEEITSPHARILVSAVAQSDRGQVRKRNEDSFLVFPEFSLYGVADGMGGYQGGQVASSIAVETLRNAYETATFSATLEPRGKLPRRGREMACAIQMANQAIIASAQHDAALTEMGTTLVAARFSPNKQRVYIGHVGDSRCYRLRGNSFRQLTKDHTLSELGMKGPAGKQLFQAVGHKAEIAIDLIVDKPQPHDVYLLCSDGLSKMISDDTVRDTLLGESDLEAAVRALIELAMQAGGKDNVTVILIKVVERISRAARPHPPS